MKQLLRKFDFHNFQSKNSLLLEIFFSVITSSDSLFFFKKRMETMFSITNHFIRTKQLQFMTGFTLLKINRLIVKLETFFNSRLFKMKALGR